MGSMTFFPEDWDQAKISEYRVFNKSDSWRYQRKDDRIGIKLAAAIETNLNKNLPDLPATIEWELEPVVIEQPSEEEIAAANTLQEAKDKIALIQAKLEDAVLEYKKLLEEM